jgi:hypothetical protein
MICVSDKDKNYRTKKGVKSEFVAGRDTGHVSLQTVKMYIYFGS